MKLIKEQTKYYVNCHTDSFGYESDNTYVFPSEDELQKFLGIKDDYEKHEYYDGTDIYGQERKLGNSEYPGSIYSRTDYEVKWEVDTCDELYK